MVKMTLGERIRYYRKKIGLTQKELAELLNVSVMTIRRLEAGTRVPKLITVEKLSKALEVDPSVLLDWNEPQEQDEEESVGDRIKTLRKEKHITQTQLANCIGVQASVISKYENNIIVPSLEQIHKIAEALGVDPVEITYGKQEKEPEPQEPPLLPFDNGKRDTMKAQTILEAVVELMKISGNPERYNITADQQAILETVIYILKIDALEIAEKYLNIKKDLTPCVLV